MHAVEVMLIVLLAAAIAACGFVIWALREVVRTMRSLATFADDTRSRLVPLLEKADITVDAVNVEILRVDSIITRFEGASERVTSASDAISDIVNAPSDLVSNVASRIRRAWKSRQGERKPHGDVSAGSAPSGHPGPGTGLSSSQEDA